MSRSDRDQRGMKPWELRARMLRYRRTLYNRSDRHRAARDLRVGREPEPVLPRHPRAVGHVVTAMLRSRQSGHHCSVEGHGSRCEVSQERPRRTRAQEKRQWRREAGRGDA